MGLLDRLQHAWNAFANKDPTDGYAPVMQYGPGYSYRPDRPRPSFGSDKTIIGSIYNRISLDVAAVSIQHVRLDSNKRYLETIDDSLNTCLTLEANEDQTGRAFIQDAVLSLFDEGCIALVPIETSIDPTKSSSYDILSMRVGKVITWYPHKVQIEVYNPLRGIKQLIYMDKKDVAIIENPLYLVMNEPNSTLKRLIRKLHILDIVDEQSGSGKLDLIVQLPYSVKSTTQMDRAEQRRVQLEEQLNNSKYGVAYMDATEHITQLNRPLENNLLKTIEFLTNLLYSQLGLTAAVFDGTADEKTMLNYYNRTLEPILSAFTDEMTRKFLTKTARTQGQAIRFFKEPFKLVPVDQLAEIADKFTRNEIMTSNEFRQVIGMKPVSDPKADQLRNSNMPQSELGVEENQNGGEMTEEELNAQYEQSMKDLDDLDNQLDELGGQ